MLGALMSKKIVLAGKGPVTFVARVRASGGVGHDVRAQVEGTREASCADRTDVNVGDLGE